MTRKPLKMPHPIEVPDKRREFSGQSEADPLVYWLNTKPRSRKQREQQERVIELLRLLGESVRRQKVSGRMDLGVSSPLRRRIARLLSHYRYVPDIRLTGQGTLFSGPPWKLPRMFAPYDDRKAVWAIGRLAERGRFSAVRECVGCGKWIFARRTDQTACDETCRARKRRKNLSEWEKEELRKKARARYEWHKAKSANRRKHK